MQEKLVGEILCVVEIGMVRVGKFSCSYRFYSISGEHVA
jgi:hypothetical protein